MEDKKNDFIRWCKLTPNEQSKIYESWNKYKGDGKEVVKTAYQEFNKKYGNSEDISKITYGVYHGGDWIIGVTLKVGSRVKIPEAFLGIRVIKFYEGITDILKLKIIKDYSGDINNFVASEQSELKKYFNFSDSTISKDWLINFVKESLKQE